MSVNLNAVNAVRGSAATEAIEALEAREKAQAAASTETPPVEKEEKAAALPVLPAPTGSVAEAGKALALPSMGASTLALLTQVLDDQRRANREVQFQEGQLVAQKLKEQAAGIRSRAVTNLTMSLVTATIQAAASVTTIVGTGKALNAASAMKGDPMASAVLQAQTTRISAASQAVQGAASGVEAVRQAINASAEAGGKVREAEIEQIRAYREQLDSLDESLKEVIRKAIATQNEIQQNMNQTRTRILG